ncbi:DUF4189 domain-containing protein [Oryzibacter oryziterrae]|uniref:DUF4189 domain-containing protein n=1 Tax=Oryzibacter oryziterrae TaxID=2766474 RepID=UPI001F247B79|nr:DUF4189 domain-containing protein [Oryzibacter oryziterrae]
MRESDRVTEKQAQALPVVVIQHPADFVAGESFSLIRSSTGEFRNWEAWQTEPFSFPATVLDLSVEHQVSIPRNLLWKVLPMESITLEFKVEPPVKIPFVYQPLDEEMSQPQAPESDPVSDLLQVMQQNSQSASLVSPSPAATNLVSMEPPPPRGIVDPTLVTRLGSGTVNARLASPFALLMAVPILIVFSCVIGWYLHQWWTISPPQVSTAETTREADLTAREATLNEQKEEQAKAAQNVMGQIAALDQREVALKQLREDLRDTQSKLDKQTTDLSDKSAALNRQEASQNQRESDLDSKNNDLTARERDLADRATAVKKLVADLIRQQTDIDTQKTQLATTQKSLTDFAAQLKALRDQLQVQQQNLAVAQAQLAKDRQDLDQRQKSLASTNAGGQPGFPSGFPGLENNFGAYAIDKQGHVWLAWNAPTVDVARAVVTGNCAKLASAQNCYVGIFTEGCIAIAVGASGGWGMGRGQSRSEAGLAAVEACRGARNTGCRVTREQAACIGE